MLSVPESIALPMATISPSRFFVLAFFKLRAAMLTTLYIASNRSNRLHWVGKTAAARIYSVYGCANHQEVSHA